MGSTHSPARSTAQSLLSRRTRRTILRNLGRQSATIGQRGFSILFAVIVALGVILTAAALSSRTFFGLFASAFQQDARRAREAAEIGSKRIISELNREQNRMLLARDPGNKLYWQQNEIDSNLATFQNPCASTAARPSTPVLLSVGSGAAAAVTIERPVVYISDNGVASSAATNTTAPATNSPNGQRYAYRLELITVTPRTPPLTWPNRGLITLRVQGFAYNAGRLNASATIEERVEVVPKCCALSLGGDNNPQFGNDLRPCNQALNPNFGFLFGTGLTDDGSADINGTKGSISDPTKQPINPLVCLGSDTSKCPPSEKIGGNTIPVVQINTPILPPEEFGEAAGTPPGAGETKNNTGTTVTPLTAPAPAPMRPCNKSACPSNKNPAVAGTSTSLFQQISSGGDSITLINAATVDLTNLPANCGTSNDTVTVARNADGTTTTRNFTTIHCNVTSLTNSNKEIFRVVTSDSRRLKLHFPNEGSKVIDMNGDLEHCSNTTCTAGSGVNTNALLRFQVLGCEKATGGPGCGRDTSATDGDGNTSNTNDQSVTLRGNSTAAAEPFFLYFPLGEITLNGGGGVADQLRGVFWINTLQGNGNVEVVVPGAGVGDILDTAVGPPPGGGGGGGPTPIVNEWVARAVRQYQLLPGL